MRRAIAEHMVRSVTTAPHAWTYVEVDVDGLVRWRPPPGQFREREGFDLTYVPFVAKALVETLREHPILNSTWRDGRVVLKRASTWESPWPWKTAWWCPSCATPTSQRGRDRPRAERPGGAGQGGEADPGRPPGGTFTLNNTGALGSVLSMPIINQPQAAILTMEAIRRRWSSCPRTPSPCAPA